MIKRLLPWVCGLSAVGCASGPAVMGSDELPVRKIVMYRSGVSYFERSGQFEGDELAFGVKAPDVGDFLSSLTAVERGDSRVRSVAFAVPEREPVDAEDDEPEDEDPRVDVELRFSDDGEHDVSVAYVVGSPIWRPAYRVVTDKDGALLQAWAVVQNTTGEDWEDVMLSLTTGAPISFRSDLGTPIVPRRPLVTDRGEVIMAVPGSETALSAGGDGNMSMADEPGDAMLSGELDEDMAYPEEEVVAQAARRQRKASASPMAPPAPEPLRPASSGSSVQTMAAVSAVGEGVTRYDLDKPVTIPDGSSTMVAVLSQRVPGERAYLFSPDGGVALSAVHPFEVVRFQNTTGANLERGTISVYGSDNFLGQGVMEPLPTDATTFVPFSVNRALAVQRNQRSQETEGRLTRIDRGRIIVERFFERKTTYELQNGSAEAAKVYVRHDRWSGAELLSPPEGTELTAQSALVPVTVPARGKGKYEVVERTPVERNVDILWDVAADAIALYLQGPAVEAATGVKLRQALELRKQLLAAQERANSARRERALLQEGANETRENLKSLRKVDRVADLRKRLTDRLADFDQKIAALTATLVDAETEVSELRVRLSELMQEVSLN